MRRLAFALAALGLGGPALAGSIQGRVDLRLERTPAETRPDVSVLGMTDGRTPPERPRTVVYLEEAPRGAFEDHDRERVVIDQRNQAFIPQVVAVMVGTTVSFPNSDRIYHNVFSLSKAKRFDLGRYARGRSKSVRFDRPGVVRVFCEIHSQMNAYVLVFAHRYFAVTDERGQYRIDRVPPGTYAVKAWNSGEVRASGTALVPASGGAAELDFVLD